MEIIQFLQHEYQRRLQQNARYSLRAFALHLEVDPSLLSKVFKGERRPGKKMCQQIEDRLGLPNGTLRNTTQPLPNACELDNFVHFDILASWEFFAVLSLVTCHDFQPSLLHIEKRLGLTHERATDVVQKLFATGMLIKTTTAQGKEKWVPAETSFHTSEDIESLALKRGHENNLLLASERLQTSSLKARDYSCVVGTAHSSKISLIKKMIAQLRDDVEAIMNDLPEDKREDVYQLNIQLFPLTIKKDYP
jgi:transcriptional regulator with XRE-family HTH domain